MNFLIQRNNEKITYDFAFELLNAIDYLNWKNKYDHHFVYYIDNMQFNVKNPDEFIPIGSVEFVQRFQQKYYPNAEEALMPLNVPEPLQDLAGRWVFNVNNVNDMAIFRHGKELHHENDKLFRKSLYYIKSPDNGIYDYNNDEDFIGYQVSEVIPHIDSEWRVFVFKNKIQHISNYSGNCMYFPNPDTIQKMVDKYADYAPVAYTLDVGVRGNTTFVIECHRFFSCGLYGFNDYSILPYMFSQEWFEMKNINKIKK